MAYAKGKEGKKVSGLSRRGFLKLSTATAIAASTNPLAQGETRNFRDTSIILSEPYLQKPGEDYVHVLWFSEQPGTEHYLDIQGTRFEATTVRLERMLEDGNSRVRGRSFDAVSERAIYQHEVVVTDLMPNVRVPYKAFSVFGGEVFESNEYTLQPLPNEGKALTLLLSSDQQNRHMSAANYQKVVETVGMVDGIIFPGDFVDHPNRASEWFDRDEIDRPAFFPALQGTVRKLHPTYPYLGGELMQNAWVFGSIGNHEVTGRWRPEVNDINGMYNDPQPRWYAEMCYDMVATDVNPEGDAEIRRRWIEDNSFEILDYEQVFRLPDDSLGGMSYYAQKVGEAFIISLDVSRIWRNWNSNNRGKFTEVTNSEGGSLNNPEEWGFGDFIFQDFRRNSEQYRWLESVLASDACQNSRCRIVMAHQSPFGLGDTSVPVMADPLVTIEYEENGEVRRTDPFTYPVSRATWESTIQPLVGARSIRFIRYAYPLEADIWRNDIEPLLLNHNVQLVVSGHSHLWNRAKVGGMHYLETSNVGNTFGAGYDGFEVRAPWAVFPEEARWVELVSPYTDMTWNAADYPRTGSPHGRQPEAPAVANPMQEFEGRGAFPFVSSNDVTVFTVFETSTGLVKSYAFDTRYPTRREVVKFDEFSLR